VVVHAFNPSTRQAERGRWISEFEPHPPPNASDARWCSQAASLFYLLPESLGESEGGREAGGGLSVPCLLPSWGLSLPVSTPFPPPPPPLSPHLRKRKMARGASTPRASGLLGSR
jgi:hypothetical protein